MKASVLILFLGLLLFPLPMMADTVGYLDIQKVILQYKKSQDIQIKLKEKQKKLEERFKKSQSKLIEARKKEKSEDQLKALIDKLEQELKPQQEELLALNKQAMSELKAEILDAAKSIAKSYGIDVILDKQAVLYGGFDITDFVLDKLNG